MVAGRGEAATRPGTGPAATASPADLSSATFSLASATTPTALSAPRGPEAAAARAAESTAATSLQAASAVQADIAASGLDIGQPATIDTDALAHATERLQSASALPETFLPGLASDVTAATAAVDQRVAELRGSLDAAVAKKAEEEAAEKARQEAEAAAAAAAKAAEEEAAAAAAQRSTLSTSSSSSTGGGSSEPFATGGGSGDNSPAGAKATARGMLSSRGWGDDQFSCLESLWNKESGWNYQAYNPSGATGIPQSLPGDKMATFGDDWQTNAATQIKWGLDYISRGYGTPCAAWGHSQATNWY